MTDPLNIHQHQSSKLETRRNSCCAFCEGSSDPLNPLERQMLSLTPPLENVYFKDEEEQPFSCIYLLNLFLAPDMTRYLAETNISDDIYSLPVHLQKLICEARMEVLVSRQKDHATHDHSALKRLEKVREYVKSVSHHETAATIATLSELIHDEDELSNILGE